VWITSGEQLNSFRSFRIWSQWLASRGAARHIRGLEEKI
jgi:hypothetical protein